MRKVTITLFGLLLVATAPNKRHSTCEEECQSYCHASSSSRQLMCQKECFIRCRVQRSEQKVNRGSAVAN